MIYLKENIWLRIWKLNWLDRLKKLPILTIWRWLNRQMLMKPSLQKTRIAMRWKMVLNINKTPNRMKSKWTLILKLLTQSKRETKYIQLNGGKYTKLYNHNFWRKLTSFLGVFIKKCNDNANEAHFLQIEVKMTYSELKWNKDYMHRWLCFFGRILNSLKQIKLKMKLNSSFKVSLQDHGVGLILTLIVLK